MEFTIDKKGNRKRYAIVIGTILFICLFVLSSRITNVLIPKTYDTVIIKPTFEKNELSTGNEIWLADVSVNGTSLNLKEDISFASGRWLFEHNHWGWRGYDQPMEITPEITLKIPEGYDRKLYFEKNIWRGKCEIIQNGKVQLIDCYGPNQDHTSVECVKLQNSNLARQIYYQTIITIILFCMIGAIFIAFMKVYKEVDIIGLKYSAMYTFICGVVVHGFVYANGLFTHDTIKLTENLDEIIFNISLGRFLQPLYRILKGAICTPWTIGLLSLIWLSLSVYLIIKLFNVKSKVAIFFIAALSVCNLSIITMNATYIQYVDTFLFTNLLSILAVYLVARNHKYSIITVMLISIVFALYPSYICVIITIFMLLIIKELIRNSNIVTIIKKGCNFIIIIVCGGLLYYCLLKIILYITQIEVSTGYNSLDAVLRLEFFNSIPQLFFSTYKYVFDFFFVSNGYNTNIIVFINKILVFITFGLLIYVLYKNRMSIANKILLSLLLLIFPFGNNIIYLLANQNVHMLMLHAIFLYYIVFVIMIEKINFSKTKCVSIFLLSIILMNSYNYANGAYIKKEIEIRNTDMLMNRVIDRVEQTENYIPGETKVIFAGYLDNSLLSKKIEGFSKYYEEYAVGLNYTNSITYGMEKYYFNWQRPYNINILPFSEKYNYETNPVVQEMPCFPNEASIKFIDDVLVVKVSDI